MLSRRGFTVLAALTLLLGLGCHSARYGGMGIRIPEFYGSDLDDVVYGRADIRTARAYQQVADGQNPQFDTRPLERLVAAVALAERINAQEALEDAFRQFEDQTLPEFRARIEYAKSRVKPRTIVLMEEIEAKLTKLASE